ncbi:MAG: DUF885 domain-containing protein [Acidobacteriota bacterium]|nr:DUF885 domain-containing protein [Acidobacteriota bacterium]
MRFVLIVFLAGLAVAQTPPAWVSKSNRNAQVLLDIIARYSPERAGSLGVRGLDDKITILTADREQHLRADLAAARETLESRLSTEHDPSIQQDLQILLAAADRQRRSAAVEERLLLPYPKVARIVFFGMKSLLDEQVAPERRAAALARLRRYTGLEPGYTPLATLARQRFEEKLKTPGLVGPSKIEVEKDLADTSAFVTGIGLLLEKFKVQDYQEAYSKLKEQLVSYDEFVRKEVLPKSRSDFRLPPELYTLALEDYGVDYTPAELTRLAHESFTEIQGEMQKVAARVAKARNLPGTDYRDVINALKKEQLAGDEILPHYRKRLSEIEEIIRREHLVTLPARPAIIRLATAAETAQQPAPHMVPPPLIDNHGERGQFVLPLGTSGEGGKALQYDDFTFAAASWTLTSHEARPGHELQFAAMVERGVSRPRAVFAFNSTNVEGWGLYAEWFMLPYMPDEGKLISLQLRLLRAARAFLDPELQQGKVTPAQALHLLQKDVVCSEAFATEEVDRYTFRAPGQAVSYFDGYTRLREIRSDAEKALGEKFNAQRFHDFILSQGLLPAALLRKAVMQDFVARP